MQLVTGTYVPTTNFAPITVSLGIEPGFVILFSPISPVGAGAFLMNYFWRTHAMSDTAVPWRRGCYPHLITNLHAGGFDVGSNQAVSRSGQTYYYVAGTVDTAVWNTMVYVGNATVNSPPPLPRKIDGLGFAPKFLMLQEQTADLSGFHQRYWQHLYDRNPAAAQNEQTAASPQFVTGHVCSTHPDGFYVGSGGATAIGFSVNQHSLHYAVLAFAEVAQTTEEGLFHGDGTASHHIELRDPFLPKMSFVRNVELGKFFASKTTDFFGETTWYDAVTWPGSLAINVNTGGIRAHEATGFLVGLDTNVNQNSVGGVEGHTDDHLYFVLKTTPPPTPAAPPAPPSSGFPSLPIFCEDAVGSGVIERWHVRSGQIFDTQQTFVSAAQSYGTTGTATWALDVGVSISTSGGAVRLAGAVSAVSSDGGLYFLSRLTRDGTVLAANSLVRHNAAIRTMAYEYLDAPAAGVHSYAIEYSHYAPNSPAGSPYVSRTLNRGLSAVEYKR